MGIQQWIAAVFAAAGVIFMIVSAIGVIHFPDFFTRLHASGIGETLGALLLTVGMIVFTGWTLLSLKVLIVFVLLLLTNPLGTNLIMMEAIHAWNYQDYNRKQHSGTEESDAAPVNGKEA